MFRLNILYNIHVSISYIYLFNLLFYLTTTNSLPSDSCDSIDNAVGRCVNFDICPYLKKLLTETPVTVLKVRTLQRLTCGFENNDYNIPLICCPVSEIRTKVQHETKIDENSGIENFAKVGTNSNLQSTGSTTPSSNYFTQPVTFSENKPTVSTVDLLPPKVDIKNRVPSERLTFRQHKNFKWMPGLKECSNTVNSDRIVGGKDAAIGSHPWMARIGYLNIETNEVEFYCAGTIINSRYILTAAHCTEEIDEGYAPAVVRLGEHDTRTDEDCSPSFGCSKTEDYVIEKVIPHSNYNKDDKSNDIELIRVSRDISFDSFAIRPICLPFLREFSIETEWKNAFVYFKNSGIVTGWGRTKWNKAEGSEILKEVQLPLVPLENCAYNYSKRIKITTNQFCAGGIVNADSCGGDSGGPLVIPVPLNGDAKFLQIGIVSFGPVQCGFGGLPGVYTRVTKYLQWILDNVEPW